MATPTARRRYGRAVPAPDSEWWRPVEDGIEFAVRVTPNSRRSEVVGILEGSLKVRLAAPPVDGKANEELRRLLGRWLGVRPSAVTVERGATSRTKHVRVVGIDRSPHY